MTLYSFYIIVFFLLSGCYTGKVVDLSPPDIEDIPDRWIKTEYQNDYKIEEIFPCKSDSTLYYLLTEFNENNLLFKYYYILFYKI